MIDDSVLDNEDFDPIDFINRRFPTESSLDDLDTFTLGISSQMSALDEELSKAVQSQIASGEHSSKEIIEAQKSIDELFHKIMDIKSKASQSERMVQEICSDIKKLDYAKTHLQSSITSLKRLQMLTTAISQLTALIGDPSSYRDIANLLDATTQIMKYFSNYGSIPLIASTRMQLEELQVNLKKNVSRTFRELGQLVEEGVVEDADHHKSSHSTLADSCMIVDALGYTFRQDLLEEFVQYQLQPYEKLFGPDRPHFACDQIERRYAWFKRLLKHFDHKYQSVFPPHWRLPLRLTLEFFERTKIHIAQLLTMMESKGTNDVHTLLKALQTTIRFETEMSHRFDIKSLSSSSSSSMQASSSSPHKPSSSSVMLNDEKLKADGKVMYVPSYDQAISKEVQDDAYFMELMVMALSGGISAVFDKFLGCYVLLERSNLEELIEKLSREEDNAAEVNNSSGNNNHAQQQHVLESSMSMFVFIKNSIKRCSALSCGQTLLSLTQEFQSCLRSYTDLLRSRCPSPIQSSSTSSSISSSIGNAMPSISSSSSSSSSYNVIYRLQPGQELVLCHIINTAEYCVEVVPQLEQMIKAKINPNLSDKVDFQQEVDAYHDLVAHAMKVLVAGCMDRFESSSFKQMLSISWGNIMTVGEESSYCHIVSSSLYDLIPKLQATLSSSFFQTFCTKFVSEFLSRYLDIIIKQKRITEMGSQQLLLDTYNLKTLFMKLPTLSSSSSSSVSSMYTKIVSSRINHIEAILKLIGTPEEVLVERFRVLWPDGGPTDLQLLMSLKGMKRSDQQSFLEGLGMGLGTATSTATSIAASTAAFTSQASSATFSFASSARSSIHAVGNMSFMNRGGGGGHSSSSSSSSHNPFSGSK